MKPKNLIYSSLFVAILNLVACSKNQNINTTEFTTADSRSIKLSAIYPPYSIDYLFDRETDLTDGVKDYVFSLDTKNPKINGDKEVYCTINKPDKINQVNGKPDFSNATMNVVSFNSGKADLTCSLDLSELPSSNGDIMIYLDIEDINTDYTILVSKKSEFSPLIKNTEGFETKDMEVLRKDLLNGKPVNIQFNNVMNTPSDIIEGAEMYVYVAKIFSEQTSHDTYLEITDIKGDDLLNNFALDLDLTGFQNAVSLTIQHYLVEKNKANKTIALQNQNIKINKK